MEKALLDMAIEILAPVAITLVTTLVSWAMLELGKYVRRKTKNEVAIHAVDRLCHTVSSTVAEIEQTLVPKFREEIGGGKLDKDIGRTLKYTALRQVKERLAPALLEDTAATITDLDAFIKAKIEQAVLAQKQPGVELLPLVEERVASGTGIKP